jgi:hypothetical protein
MLENKECTRDEIIQFCYYILENQESIDKRILELSKGVELDVPFTKKVESIRSGIVDVFAIQQTKQMQATKLYILK